jgi:hypothetical protein
MRQGFSLRNLAFCIVWTAVGVFCFAGVSSASLQACTPPVVPVSVIAGAQVAVQTATTLVSDAQTAWPVIKLLLPTGDQAAAQDAFDKAVFATNHAILATNDAIGAAIAANNPNPDLSVLLSALGDAVAQVVAVVQEFQGKAPGAKAHAVTPNGVDAVADMQAAAARLKVSKK